jgi:hypothetical protein
MALRISKRGFIYDGGNGRVRFPLGTERIRIHENGVREWYVKVSHTGLPKHRWKRKAKIVAESILQRKLTRAENHDLSFVDGDRLNCSPSNILVPHVRGMLVCETCGNSRSLNTHKLKLSRVCKNCRMADSTAVRRLDNAQVACIKKLVWKVPDRWISRWFLVSATAIEGIRKNLTWKGVEPMAKTQVWKTLLAQHDKLKSKNGSTMFDRVTLLAKVYEDPHFTMDMDAQGKKAIEILDGKVSDTCANFTELLQMLKMFPRKGQWADGNLNEMRVEMHEELRVRQNKANGVKPRKSRKKTEHRRTATLTEVRELKHSIDTHKSEVEHLREKLDTANKLIQVLESQLESSRETIGSLNETISLLKMKVREKASKYATA